MGAAARVGVDCDFMLAVMTATNNADNSRYKSQSADCLDLGFMFWSPSQPGGRFMLSSKYVCEYSRPAIQNEPGGEHYGNKTDYSDIQVSHNIELDHLVA